MYTNHKQDKKKVRYSDRARCIHPLPDAVTNLLIFAFLEELSRCTINSNCLHTKHTFNACVKN